MRLFFFIVVCVPSSLSHMYLNYPPARSNYDIDGKFTFNDCGFKTVYEADLTYGNAQCLNNSQPYGCYTSLNCGVCGDDISFTPARRREYGYPNPNNPLPRLPTGVYRQGATIPIVGSITSPHFGYFQYRICKNILLEANSNISIAQGCFNENLLNISSVSDPYGVTRISPKANNMIQLLNHTYVTVTSRAVLPEELSGDHLTLQQTYLSNWNWWPASVEKVGYGGFNWKEKLIPQRQQFRSCADIRIVPRNDFSFFQNILTLRYLSANYQPVTSASCQPSPLSLHGSSRWDEFFVQNGSIIFDYNNQCLAVNGGSKDEGATVTLRTCANSSSQMWWFHELRDDYFQIWNQNSLKCLTSKSDGSIVQWSCDTSFNNSQAWKLYNSNDFCSHYIQNNYTALHLSWNGNSNPVTSHSRPSQPMSISLESTISWNAFYNTPGSIAFRLNGLCFNVRLQSLSDGIPVVQSQCENATSQEWLFRDLGDGYFQIVNQNSNKCLSSLSDGSAVQITCNNADSLQSWTLYTDEFSSVLKNKNTSLYLNGAANYYPAMSVSCQLEQPKLLTTSTVSLISTLPWDNFYTMNGSIVFESNGLCLDVFGQQTGGGAMVGQYKCQNSANQGWWFNATDSYNKYFQIVNRNSGKCVSIIQDGSMVQNTCNSSDFSQTWKLFNSTKYCSLSL